MQIPSLCYGMKKDKATQIPCGSDNKGVRAKKVMSAKWSFWVRCSVRRWVQPTPVPIVE
jgi:hypothetical protein